MHVQLRTVRNCSSACAMFQRLHAGCARNASRRMMWTNLRSMFLVLPLFLLFLVTCGEQKSKQNRRAGRGALGEISTSFYFNSLQCPSYSCTPSAVQCPIGRAYLRRKRKANS